MSNYEVVRCGDMLELEKIVDNMINDGWIPSGGISCNLNGHYIQAMWRPPLPSEVKIIMERATDMEPIKK